MTVYAPIMKGLSNAEYHAQQPVEEHYFSSSQVKKAYQNIGLFRDMFITRTVEGQKESAALRRGTYFHAMVLEPDTLPGGKDEEIVLYNETKTRRGDKWVAFQEANKGKTIVTQTEKEEAEYIAEIALKDGNIRNLLQKSEYEISYFLNDLMGFRVKARADIINKSGFVADLKSCAGDAQDSDYIKGEISKWGYDVSAAFYLDIINACLEKAGEDYRIDTWFWAFASGAKSNSKVYQATDDMIRIGRYKYQLGMKAMAKAQANNWEIPNEIEYIDPVYWDREFLDKEEQQTTGSKGSNFL